MAQIPGPKSVPFYRRKTFIEFISVVPPVIAGAITAYGNYADPTKRNFGYLLFFGLLFLVAGSLLRISNAREQDKAQDKSQEHQGLVGALHTLYGCVDEYRKTTAMKDAKFRATIHRVASDEELQQLLPYIGEGGGGANRKFSVRSGIIGRAVREKDAFAASRQNEDYEQFIEELVRVWSYTEADARALKTDRRAWMAVPIRGERDTIAAVVFLDSNQRDFFTPEAKQLIIQACSGIASYIHQAYPTTKG
jgi:putative methionine-R-sulfoxide reductase with GAF domain